MLKLGRLLFWRLHMQQCQKSDFIYWFKVADNLAISDKDVFCTDIIYKLEVHFGFAGNPNHRRILRPVHGIIYNQFDELDKLLRRTGSCQRSFPYQSPVSEITSRSENVVRVRGLQVISVISG